jgi:hypothetical protein
MSYATLIHNSVAQAFTAIGDLKKTFILTKSSPKTFNFSSGEVSSGASESITVEGVVMSKSKKDPSTGFLHSQVIFKAKNLVDLTAYDILLDGAVVWKISGIVTSDGYLTMADIHR